MYSQNDQSLDGLGKIRLKKLIKAPIKMTKKVVKTSAKVTKKVAKSKIGKVAMVAAAIYGGYLLAPKLIGAMAAKKGAGKVASTAVSQVARSKGGTSFLAKKTLLDVAGSTASFAAPIAQQALVARMSTPQRDDAGEQFDQPIRNFAQPGQPVQNFVPGQQPRDEASFGEKLMNTIIPTASASDDGTAPEKLPPWVLPAVIGGGVLTLMVLKKRK